MRRQPWVVGRGPVRWGVLGLEVVVVWGALLAAMIGLGLLVTGPLDDSVGRADDHVSGWFVDHRSPPLTTLAQIGETPGETIVVMALGVCVAAAAWAWTRSPRPALFIILALIGQSAMYYLAAEAVGRARPSVRLLDQGLDPTHSFPSGHVAAAVTLWGGLAILIWTYLDSRWRPLAVLLLVLPPVVAASRLYEGVHHLTDVLASLIVISVWLVVTATIVLRSVVDADDP